MPGQFQLRARFSSPLVTVRDVRCRPRHHHPSDEELVRVPTLVFARAGLYLKHLSLNDLARCVHTSVFHLSRVFRAQTGLPIHRYLRHLRLRTALERLAENTPDLTRLASTRSPRAHPQSAKPRNRLRPSRTQTHRTAPALPPARFLRLPGDDVTRRAETAAHLILGMACLWTLGLSAVSLVRFLNA